MTLDELDATIAEVIIPQLRPRSTQNSFRRKQWENQRIWRLCTAGKSCKLGAYKQIFNDGKNHEDLEYFSLESYYRGIAGMFRSKWSSRVREYSYNKKFIRRYANRHVRHYSGEIGNHSFYRKIFDYEWECW
ncbi:MAG: hypothetical protein IJT57_05060 [Selenomonadaceae bacterium]|nr:hypothetical protein [Selenomonadaceae bacterium]MBQ7723675.1 hypothetical protein [Selenomonadaceae bacterium]